jgi:hypothetical protein
MPFDASDAKPVDIVQNYRRHIAQLGAPERSKEKT